MDSDQKHGGVKTKKIILDVPYYSQRLDVKDSFWQPRSCGIVALAMAMDYVRARKIIRASYIYKNRFGSNDTAANQKRARDILKKLINEGVAMGVRDPKYGWIHDGLVMLAKRHGFKKSFRKEFDFGSRTSNNVALSYMIALLKLGIPILASVRFKSSGHLVLLTGYSYLGVGHLSGFFYHDPNSRSRKVGAHKFISTSEFLKKWKGRLIVVK